MGPTWSVHTRLCTTSETTTLARHRNVASSFYSPWMVLLIWYVPLTGSTSSYLHILAFKAPTAPSPPRLESRRSTCTNPTRPHCSQYHL